MNARQKAQQIVEPHEDWLDPLDAEILRDHIEQALQEAAKVEMPSEDEIEDELDRVWGAHGDNLYRNGWRDACDWLKSRLKNVGE